MSSPSGPRFSPSYEPTFEAHRVALGLSGRNFDHFFQEVENFICGQPWRDSQEVPDGEGMRMQPTHDAAPDIPPLYVYFRVETDPNVVRFHGLSPAWSATDTI